MELEGIKIVSTVVDAMTERVKKKIILTLFIAPF